MDIAVARSWKRCISGAAGGIGDVGGEAQLRPRAGAAQHVGQPGLGVHARGERVGVPRGDLAASLGQLVGEAVGLVEELEHGGFVVASVEQVGEVPEDVVGFDRGHPGSLRAVSGR